MKELTMKELRKYAEENKVKYPVGSRLVIIEMHDDRLTNPYVKTPPYPAGLRGTVQLVDDMGQVHCLFDNGASGLALNELDKFRPLADYELEEEETMKKAISVIETEQADDFYDCLYDEVARQFDSDDDTPEHKYRMVVRRYLTDKDPAVKDLIDLCFESICGWKLSTLLSNALDTMNDDSFKASDGENYTEIGEKHISEVKTGDLILLDGDVYEATSDAYLFDSDIGKEWNVEVEGIGSHEYLYASFFVGGTVTVVERKEDVA